MQIKRVKLKNFRQFYGEQEIDFSVSENQNVTLVHAENGFGKTSILNAVLWCLFNQTTPKFEQPNDIVNYEAADEGANTAVVEVEFEFNDDLYIVQRHFNANSKKRDRTELLAFRLEGGGCKPLNAAETFVSSVVPPEMAKYFFFDGEAAESFAAARNYKEIASAIRTILGCSLADTAVADMKAIQREVDRAISNASGDDRITAIEKRLEELDSDLESYAKLREERIADIATLEQQHQDLQEQLRNAEATKSLQKERDGKESELNDVDAEIGGARHEIVRWIGQRAMQVVSSRISQVTLDFVDEAALHGKIPSPYNEDFVKGLLQSETCVCHRPLKPETNEWKAVAELLKTASNEEVLGRVVRARSRSQLLKEEASEAPKILSGHQERLKLLLDKRGRLEQDVASLGKKLESINIAEIAEKERARRTIKKRIDEFQQQFGGIKAHIVALDRQRNELDRELQELARKNKKTVRLLAKKQLLIKATGILQTLLDRYESEAREKIELQINSILEVVAHKDFNCKINSNFSIELVHDERVTAKSAGENQLLSLVFIASLVKFAADRIGSDEPILKPGTMAPLVLDAPLGQLDPSYQQSVAEFLPELAGQVILLVSGSQGGDNVLKALQPYVGAEYLLIQENRTEKGKRDGMKRAIHGKEHELILFGQDHTMTQIRRLD